ncbi:hypothetical protein ACP3V3_02210 [Vibrio sp. PNB22_3_1]
MILDQNELLATYKSAVVERDIERIDLCSRSLGALLGSNKWPAIDDELKESLKDVHVEAFDYVKSERSRVDGAIKMLQRNQNRDKAYLETSKAL